jgi:hypothetical protein
MKRMRLSKKPDRDADFWRTVGSTLWQTWGGDPRAFIADCKADGPEILKRLAGDAHKVKGKKVYDYPSLRGPKIAPLWLRMLRDTAGIELRNLDLVDIPVDVHVARATFTTGVVHGSFRGSSAEAYALVRQAWRDSVKGLTVAGRPMMALDVDEPLWHLSKYGCSPRRRPDGVCAFIDRCEAKAECVKGSVMIGAKGTVEIET